MMIAREQRNPPAALVRREEMGVGLEFSLVRALMFSVTQWRKTPPRRSLKVLFLLLDALLLIRSHSVTESAGRRGAAVSGGDFLKKGNITNFTLFAEH